jgi:diguanylate cyclase (GGDEF)-like protein
VLETPDLQLLPPPGIAMVSIGGDDVDQSGTSPGPDPWGQQALDLLVDLLEPSPPTIDAASSGAGMEAPAVEPAAPEGLLAIWRPLLARVLRSSLVDAVAVLRSDQLLAWAGLSYAQATGLCRHLPSRPLRLALEAGSWHAAWEPLDAETTLVMLCHQPLDGVGAMQLTRGLARLLRLHEQAQRLLVDERRGREQAQEQVMRDPLTGLPNRIRAHDHLEEILMRGDVDAGEGTVVLFLDLDNFKLINDAYGHRIGDCFLITCSKIMRDLLRPGDLAARLAGDEFIIICQDCSLQQANALADRLIEQIARPMTIGTSVICHSASIGIAAVGPQDRARTVIENADLAMMRAKQLGRGRASRFDLQLRSDVKARASLEDALRQAIRQQEIRCWYQPIVCLPHGQIYGFEALARWHHPREGLITPDAFIPVAEDSGQIADLDTHILREACASLAAWRREFPHLDLRISTNISARTLRDPKIASRVDQALKAHGIESESLHLEITETMLVDNVQSTTNTLEKLRILGISLAIDDFGTGYSSLRYLREFPIGFLKIDQSFVAGLGESGHDDVIVAAVVRMAASLGLEVIAEGVERREQAILLHALGCRYAKGYLFGRPVDGASARALLQAEAPSPAGTPPAVP